MRARISVVYVCGRDRQTDRRLWSVVTFAKYRTTRRRSPERSLAREDSEIVIEIRQRRHGPRES